VLRAGGVVDPALLAVNGTTRAARTSSMMAVAPQPPARDASVAGACLVPAPLGRAVARSGSSAWTQRVPSQNDNAILHSATRRTQGVPWLCGPASRRVCLFVDARSERGGDGGVARGGSTLALGVLAGWEPSRVAPFGQWRKRSGAPPPKYRDRPMRRA
jgi:hypothetical protein